MKFSKYFTNVEIYPIISLVLFTVIFLIVVLYAFCSDKDKMQKNANIPLD